MDKVKIFSKYLDMIQSEPIRSFTEFSLLNAPEYFWSLPASTGGKNHNNDETLLDHIFGCLYMAELVIEQFSKHWTQRQNDQLISAIILHDCWRCHNADNEISYYTKAYVEESGHDIALVGKLRTSPEHPEAGFRNLLLLSTQFNKNRQKDNLPIVASKDLSAILKSVRFHYGPWSKDGFSLSWPYDSVVMQVHNIDFHQSFNAKFWSKKMNKNVLKFKRLSLEAKLPSYAKDGDSGMDVCAMLNHYGRTVVIKPGERAAIPTGWSVEIPKGFEIQVRPRSGLAIQNGVTVLNTPGTIDCGYRGECKVIMINLGSNDFEIKDGDRIAQFVLAPVVRAEIVEVDELSETERGDGGFGSTGIKG